MAAKEYIRVWAAGIVVTRICDDGSTEFERVCDEMALSLAESAAYMGGRPGSHVVVVGEDCSHHATSTERKSLPPCDCERQANAQADAATEHENAWNDLIGAIAVMAGTTWFNHSARRMRRLAARLSPSGS